MHLLEEPATNTSLRSHYHLIQWLVHHLHLVFQTKGLVLYSSCKSAFQLEIWMLLDVAYYIIMSPLVTIMKSKDTLFHYSKCLLQTLIWYVDCWLSILHISYSIWILKLVLSHLCMILLLKHIDYMMSAWWLLDTAAVIKWDTFEAPSLFWADHSASLLYICWFLFCLCFCYHSTAGYAMDRFAADVWVDLCGILLIIWELSSHCLSMGKYDCKSCGI